MVLVRRSADVFTTVGTIVGGALIVIGVVALARAGLSPETLTTAVEVGPFTRTPLMALIEVVVGLSVLAASVGGERGSLYVLGVLAVVFAVVWLIEPAPFTAALGVGRATAVLYLVVGAVCLAAGTIRGVGTVVRER